MAWVSLDRFDDDPGLLLTLLAAAYARLAPGMARPGRRHGRSGRLGAGPGGAAAGRGVPGQPDAVRADARRRARAAVAGLPRRAQRGDLRDPVAVRNWSRPAGSSSRTWRGCGPRVMRWSCWRVTWRWTPDGARQIFSAARVSLTAEAAAAVTARTEGWPVGLHLAALIARDGGGDPTAITGDDRYVADYLYRESLARLPESTQRFLRRTAVLDQLSAPLCDAVLGEPGAQAQLRGLEASSAVPDPARPSPGVVPLPRVVPGVPARRAPSRRARGDHQAAPAGRRLVRVQRVPGDRPGAPAEHRPNASDASTWWRN